MKFLLDTCTISDAVKGDAATLAQLRATPPDEIAVSVITCMEIDYGLALNAQRARKIGAFLKALLSACRIVEFGPADAQATAAMRAALAKRGKPIGDLDSLIAGTAVARGLILVSANEREFRRVSGLALRNWRSGRVPSG